MGHALLSASGASRWMACPPSARAEAVLPETYSQYAEEGTLAHALAELQLLRILGRISVKDHSLKLEQIKKEKLYEAQMLDYVEEYTDAVTERISAAKKPQVLLEETLDFSKYVPEGYGTGDVVIIYDGTVEVIDLKYGKGVKVSAEGNPQMRLYGLGALETYDAIYDIKAVRTTIIQPRLGHLSAEELTAEELRRWAREEVQPAAKLAHEGVGDFNPGEHCRFCKLGGSCRKRAEENLKLARYEFREPAQLSPDEISDILEKVESLTNWANAVKSHALKEAERGVKLPGYKLVEGRSTRRYTDEAAIAAKLKKSGIEDVWEKSLIGLTKMEKKLGKKKTQDLIGDFIIKPPGKPALAPLADKRPEYNSAAADFKEEK